MWIVDTGDKILVEASPYDRIWGIGLSATHPDAKNPAKWKGENLLGKVLMDVRNELRTRETLGRELREEERRDDMKRVRVTES